MGFHGSFGVFGVFGVEPPPPPPPDISTSCPEYIFHVTLWPLPSCVAMYSPDVEQA